MTARRRIAVSYMFNNAFARSLSVSTCFGPLDSRNLFIFNFVAPGSIVWYCIRSDVHMIMHRPFFSSSSSSVGVPSADPCALPSM